VVSQEIASSSQASQGTGAVASASATKLLIRKIIGEKEASPGQEIRYWVAQYSKNNNEVSPQDRSKIRWAVKTDGKIRELKDKNGESIALEIKSEWASKEIAVMAYFEGFNENVCQKTMVGSLERLLVKKVEGKAEALPGEVVRYEVASYSIDKNAVSTEDKNRIRWAIKVGDNDIEELVGENSEKVRGHRIGIEMDSKWAGKKILIMACVEEFNEKVSQETKLGNAGTDAADETASKRPRWKDVYDGYPLINRGASNENDLPAELVFKSILEDNSANRAMFNNFSSNAGATRLSIALIRAGMTLRKDFNVQVGDLKGKGFIASAINLIKWLSEPEQFGAADIIIKNTVSLADVRSRIGNKRGIYAFESNDYKRASGLTTLWYNGDAIGGNNCYDLAKEIHFWELK
jgi:hypothetical protein